MTLSEEMCKITKNLSVYHSSGLQRPLLHRSPLRLEIGELLRMRLLFAILLLPLYSLHRLGQLHPIEGNFRACQIGTS